MKFTYSLSNRHAAPPLGRAKGKRFRQGQTLVEYALILAIISILAIAMMIQLTSNVRTIYSNIDSQVSRANTGS
jgi:Flp pilus assembly pilin Flp